MRIEAAPTIWVKEEFAPLCEEFMAAVRDNLYARKSWSEPPYNPVLVDCLGLTLGHKVSDALNRAQRVGEKFPEESLFEIADRLDQALSVATEAGFDLSSKGLPHWINFVCENIGTTSWDQQGQIVVGRIDWTSRGSWWGPDMATKDWAIGKIVDTNRSLKVLVGMEDRINFLQTPSDFEIDLRLTLEAQSSEYGVTSVINRIRGRGERVLSGLEELGITDGKLYPLENA